MPTLLDGETSQSVRDELVCRALQRQSFLSFFRHMQREKSLAPTRVVLVAVSFLFATSCRWQQKNNIYWAPQWVYSLFAFIKKQIDSLAMVSSYPPSLIRHGGASLLPTDCNTELIFTQSHFTFLFFFRFGDISHRRRGWKQANISAVWLMKTVRRPRLSLGEMGEDSLSALRLPFQYAQDFYRPVLPVFRYLFSSVGFSMILNSLLFGHF